MEGDGYSFLYEGLAIPSDVLNATFTVISEIRNSNKVYQVQVKYFSLKFVSPFESFKSCQKVDLFYFSHIVKNKFVDFYAFFVAINMYGSYTISTQ